MDFFITAFEYFLHIDRHLGVLVESYGLLTYAIIFLIIFLETGVILTPFLPGDSLIFAAGVLATVTILNPVWLFVIIFVAAVLGDTTNYWIGHVVGSKIFEKDRPFINENYLKRTQIFYEKHGKKTIILARFIPIVRTFAPFVAGISKMQYGIFLTYNILGGLIWSGLFVFLGYFFGNLPIVKNNFGITVVIIIIVSMIPAFVEYWKSKRAKPESIK